MNWNMTNRHKVLLKLSQIDLFTGPFNLILSPAGPAQAPVLYRRLLVPPGVLPSPGLHACARGPEAPGPDP